MGQPPKSSGWKQLSTLSRRQVRLILADRGYLAFLVVLPFVLGVLCLVVPGKNGFAAAPPILGPDGQLHPQLTGEVNLSSCWSFSSWAHASWGRR
ncbi:Uncharacterised protein [Nocardia africana]|uniref:Uncharacterized protein n=1 Tax=Nocardia africana TaxID=134964 RepID=A0A378WMQ3_9NOCA|nr:hypothetical protein [Nocardia africana]SUA41875.1 Uncharacterised protein [Nocardia africana]